jgi:hypothetical protein
MRSFDGLSVSAGPVRRAWYNLLTPDQKLAGTASPGMGCIKFVQIRRTCLHDTPIQGGGFAAGLVKRTPLVTRPADGQFWLSNNIVH